MSIIWSKKNWYYYSPYTILGEKYIIPTFNAHNLPIFVPKMDGIYAFKMPKYLCDGLHPQ